MDLAAGGMEASPTEMGKCIGRAMFVGDIKTLFFRLLGYNIVLRVFHQSLEL